MNIIENKFKYIVKVFLTIAVILFLASTIEIEQVLRAIKNSNKSLLFFAFMLVAANIFLQFSRFRILLKSLFKYDRKKNILKSIFAGIFYGSITPFNVGEYWGRLKYINTLLKKKVIIATFAEKLFTQFVVYLCGFSSLIFLIDKTDKQIFSNPLIYIVVLFLIVSSIIYLIKYKCRLLIFIEKILSRFDKRLAIDLFLFSFINFAVIVLQYSLIISSIGNIRFSFELIFISIMFFFLKTVIPSITIGDIGLRESISLFLLTVINIDSTIAIMAGTILYILNILLPSLIYLIFNRK